MEHTMDRMRKLTALLLLIPGISFAVETETQIWIGTGYEKSLYSITTGNRLTRKVLADGGLAALPVNTLSISCDESSPFIVLEAERPFSNSFSGSLRLMLQHPDRSILPVYHHTSGTVLEAFGKYRHNSFTYAVGCSVRQDQFNISYFDNGYSNESFSGKIKTNTIATAFSLASEMDLNEYSKLSFIITTPTTPNDTYSTAGIITSETFNTKIAVSYNLKNL